MSSRMPLRELSTTEILSRSINIYLARYKLFLIPFLFTNLANGALSQLMYSFMSEFFLPQDLSKEFFLWLVNYLANTIPVIAFFAIVGWIISMLSNGIAVKFSSDMLEGTPPNLKRGVNLALSSISSLLVTGFIVGALTILGLILFIIPGIIMSVMFSLTVQAIMIERLGVSRSLRRSRELVTGRWGKTFAVLLLVLLATIAASLVGGTIAGLVEVPSDGTGETVRWLIISLLTSIVQPLQPISLTYLYYSLHIREQLIRPTTRPTVKAPVPPLVPFPSVPSREGFRPRFCHKCRQRLQSDAIYCPKCGVRVRLYRAR